MLYLSFVRKNIRGRGTVSPLPQSGKSRSTWLSVSIELMNHMYILKYCSSVYLFIGICSYYSVGQPMDQQHQWGIPGVERNLHLLVVYVYRLYSDYLARCLNDIVYSGHHEGGLLTVDEIRIGPIELASKREGLYPTVGANGLRWWWW